MNGFTGVLLSQVKGICGSYPQWAGLNTHQTMPPSIPSIQLSRDRSGRPGHIPAEAASGFQPWPLGVLGSFRGTQGGDNLCQVTTEALHPGGRPVSQGHLPHDEAEVRYQIQGTLPIRDRIGIRVAWQLWTYRHVGQSHGPKAVREQFVQYQPTSCRPGLIGRDRPNFLVATSENVGSRLLPLLQCARVVRPGDMGDSLFLRQG